MYLCIYTMVFSSQLGTPPDAFVPLVERVDTGEDHVLVYVKEVRYTAYTGYILYLPLSCMYVLLFFASVPQVLKGVPMSCTIRLKQILVVKNLKPTVINVYDYYQTSTLTSFDSCTWLLPVSFVEFDHAGNSTWIQKVFLSFFR